MQSVEALELLRLEDPLLQQMRVEDRLIRALPGLSVSLLDL